MHSSRQGRRIGRLTLQGERTLSRVEVQLTDGVYREVVLLPDRWNIVFEPPSGWTTVTAELNGEPWREPALELSANLPDTFLDWQIAAPGRVEGKVVANGVPSVPLALDCMAPGAWAQLQHAAGWKVPSRLEAVSDVHGDWALDLPDGRWRVRPVIGPGSVARPEVLEVDVPSGGTVRADFQIEFSDAESAPPSLIVQVQAPDGKAVTGAKVAVLDARTKGMRRPRAGSGLMRPAPAEFALQEGSYLVVGSHPDFLDGSLQLGDFVPGPEPKTRSGASPRGLDPPCARP